MITFSAFHKLAVKLANKNVVLIAMAQLLNAMERPAPLIRNVVVYYANRENACKISINVLMQ